MYVKGATLNIFAFHSQVAPTHPSRFFEIIFEPVFEKLVDPANVM